MADDYDADNDCNLQIHVYPHHKPSKDHDNNHYLSRLHVVQQLFHAYTNRTEAYNLSNWIGLVLFGTTANCTCELTPFYSKFKESVDSAKPAGDTCCYDALLLASTKLEAFVGQNPGCRKRIVCLTDGKDTKSVVKAYETAKTLVANNIVVDSIFIGIVEYSVIMTCSLF